MQKALYLRILFKETDLEVDSPLVTFEDNKACIFLLLDIDKHKRTKHIDYIDFLYVLKIIMV